MHWKPAGVTQATVHGSHYNLLTGLSLLKGEVVPALAANYKQDL